VVGDAAPAYGRQVKDAGAAFEVLAEPTRRAVVEALVVRPRTPGELARELRITPQALSRHLRSLRRAGFVRATDVHEDMRQRVYRIDPQALRSLRSWLARAEALWSRQLAAFRDFAEREDS
jgi:DNA-binding transcriptional ArsR family regulator